jgi:hypothetical protein
MEQWDEDFFNMEVQAYIDVLPDNLGNFQFGLISAQLHGRTIDYAGKNRFEFIFEGNDEGEPVNGYGWVMYKEKDVIEGEFRFHLGDSSYFVARKA